MVDTSVIQLNMSDALQTQLFQKVQHAIFSIMSGMGIRYCAVSFAPGARKGEAFLGRILEIDTYNQIGKRNKPVNFTVKFGFEEELRDNNIYPLRQGYDREIFMYEKVFPQFEKLQFHLTRPFKEYPKYYASDCSQVPEYIILSNKKYDRYEIVSRTEPLKYPHMFLAIKHYARFHALSFALRQKRPDIFGEIATVTRTHFDIAIKDTDVDFISIHLERALGTLIPHLDREAIIKFQQLEKEHFHELTVNATSASIAGHYAVICHGDASITNLMYRYPEGKDDPTEIAFIDFQLAKLGSPALDLSELFFTCTDKAFRDKYYFQLLQEYHKELLNFGQQLNIRISMSYATLEEHMRQFSIYGLYKTILNLYLQMCVDSDIPDIEQVLSSADCMQNYDHSCNNLKAYKERMRTVLTDFVEFGYNLPVRHRNTGIFV